MATNSKARKGHKEKVAKRNRNIQEAKNRQNKMMQEYFRQIKEMQTKAALESAEVSDNLPEDKLLPDVINVSEDKL